MADGALVLVVGPSGAGKDTLIGAAVRRIGPDPRFCFPRRTVTREAVAELEDHESVSPQRFVEEKLAGAYALDWEAHGLSYGIPASITQHMRAGKTVIVNCSRRIVADAMARFPHCHVLVVNARPEVRAERLAARGRESSDEIARRLAREGAAVPEDVPARVIDNSDALEEGIARFVSALEAIADGAGGLSAR
ncbi:phosphonate metabolism protein/1,5-bisphosphokinase (PRPP-forming) PhnN [Devosia sp.]|uniref:phosphonate metabolism protein/1,5-bisphosphokinase (PRPP-forming) PhnN n=1 Tax=Devosia sp. TaxID=1871048 RepID=UPI003A8F8A43